MYHSEMAYTCLLLVEITAIELEYRLITALSGIIYYIIMIIINLLSQKEIKVKDLTN